MRKAFGKKGYGIALYFWGKGKRCWGWSLRPICDCFENHFLFISLWYISFELELPCSCEKKRKKALAFLQAAHEKHVAWKAANKGKKL